jgi:hypothetical protein
MTPTIDPEYPSNFNLPNEEIILSNRKRGIWVTHNKVLKRYTFYLDGAIHLQMQFHRLAVNDLDIVEDTYNYYVSH